MRLKIVTDQPGAPVINLEVDGLTYAADEGKDGLGLLSATKGGEVTGQWNMKYVVTIEAFNEAPVARPEKWVDADTPSDKEKA